MAHLGCYGKTHACPSFRLTSSWYAVPAQFASLRCIDQLFTRMSGDEEIESNCSTFASEMKEAAYILNVREQ